MVEDKIGRRALLAYAVIGIDTKIIHAAKMLDSDRDVYAKKGVEITKLSDIRKEIGEELKLMDAAENEDQ